MTKKILVDGDVVRYRCGFAAQKTHYYVNVCEDVEELTGPSRVQRTVSQFDNAKDCNAWLKQNRELHPEVEFIRHSAPVVEPVENALHSVKLTMQRIQERFPDHEMVVYFSCPTSENWRTELYPQYKANRPDRRPVHDAAIREYMEKHYDCRSEKGLEADDLIALAARGFRWTSAWRAEDAGYVIASIDKDLKQIPGTHYDFTKDEIDEVDVDTAWYLLEKQKITGDAVDNIPGLAGWGEKKAAAHLGDGASTAWDAYKSFYDDLDVAWYQFCLNQALVTLPSDRSELEWLKEEVIDAREACEGVPTDGEEPSDGDGSARVGATDTTEDQATC